MVPSGDHNPVRHKLLLAGSGERAAVTLTRVTGYRHSPGEDDDAQLFAQIRTLRIRQRNSLDSPMWVRPRRSGPLRFYL